MCVCVRGESASGLPPLNSFTIAARRSVMTLEAIRYRAGSLQILNQLLLPHHTVYDDLRSVQDAYEAIKSMKVRRVLPSPSRPLCTYPRGTWAFPPPMSALLLCSGAAHATFTLVVVLWSSASGCECTCRWPQTLDDAPLSLKR